VRYGCQPRIRQGEPASPGQRDRGDRKPAIRRPAAARPSSITFGSEVRVLRYLPTNLRAPEIARELSVSPNTVKTHIRHLYAKLGTHHRAEAVDLARALGLLAPARRSPASR
jgi:DNA-binding CsgD family transcriptional regulator